MKQLSIHHIPAQQEKFAQVRVEFRLREGVQPQERAVPFSFGLSTEERKLIQWYLEEYLLFPWGEFRNRAQTVEELMARKGIELFDAIFSHRDTQTLYARVADDLPNTRIVIHAGDPEGISLPWELMSDPQRTPYGNLAGQAYAFVRSQSDLVFLPPEPKEGETFNILMVICRPGGPHRDVAFQSVARPLLELFRPHRHRIHLDILRPPTFERLSKVLREKPGFYHVLHFDGHGTFPEGVGGDLSRFYAQAGIQGQLAFEGEDGAMRLVTGEELGRLLVSRTALIVLLNACQSGMTHPEAVYPSVGNQLLRAGASGVVAMSYSVYVQTAVRFMARLYEGLLQGDELARAVALAREELRDHPQRDSAIGQVPLQDWVVPVLFEAGVVYATSNPMTGLRLRASRLNNEQATAGTEIDCPRPPDFGFIGRDGTMLDLERAFQTQTMVLLQGMAGIGKTEASAGFARWRAETGALEGPIFFFSFEYHLPLIQVCNRVGQTFQQVIKEQLHEEWHLCSAERKRELALDLLRQIPCLLIWDNFEPVAGFPTGTPSVWTDAEQQELKLFLQELQGGATKVLLTSRREERWLGNLYRLVELGGLTLVEAQELALRVLRRTLRSEQIQALPDYNDLLRYLKGNPLAIQTILPELKRTSPEALLQALQAGEAPLSREDEKLGRDRSLFASLTYRLDTLDPALRQRLGLLWLFHGFVTTPALAMLCEVTADPPALLQGLQNEDWIRMLRTVSELGLLREIATGYYTLHPVLPWFFHEVAQEVFSVHQQKLEQAFVAVYHELGALLFWTFNTNAQFAIQLLQLQESNLLQALRLGRQHQLWDRLPGMLYGLQILWKTQGRWEEWERLLTELEALALDAQGDALAGREYLWLCLMGHKEGLAGFHRDFDAQETINHRLREHYERVGDERNHAASLNQLGRIAEKRRQWDEAEQWYRKSLSINDRIGNEHGQTATLHNLGVIAQERHQWDEAERWHKKSLSINERIGDEHGQAQTLHQLGRIAEVRGQWDEAERLSQQSLSIQKRIGDEPGQASILHQLGRIALERNHWDEAERWSRQSLSIKERIGDEHGLAATLHQLGMIAQERRHRDEASHFYAEAEAIYVRLKDEYNLQIVRSSIQRLKESRDTP